jgi:Flp pilus assembly pilin Flp
VARIANKEESANEVGKKENGGRAMWTRMQQQVSAWVKDEEGASMVEYILLVALIAVVAAVGFTLLGQGIKGKTETVNTQITKP